jgi:gluconokinase
MAYFPRMLEKIRLHAAGQLRDDLHTNLGAGHDKTLCEFLRIEYAALREKALVEPSDEAVLAWCEEKGRALNETDKKLWKHYVLKYGLHDEVAEILARRKRESGFENRTDIITIAQYIDADEGRPI